MPPSIQRPRLKKSAAIAGAAVALVGGFEGLRTAAYADPVGIPTICFGETRGVILGDVATRAQCDEMLKAALADFSRAIDRCLPGNIPDAPYVAFLSVAYNIGPAAFCASSMARLADLGDAVGACNAILMWDKVTVAGAKVRLPGLTNRRRQEQRLCLSGIPGLPT